MKANPLSQEELLALVPKIHPNFIPVWHGRSREEKAALAAFFLPHRSRKELLSPTRPRVVKWYCPFASQAQFPTGHRYCINVHVGCLHGCVYCYAAGYEPEKPSSKKDFRRLIDRDLADLDQFQVPPAPVHLSNSTDLFQPLERETGHAKYALEQILAHRHRFTTVTMLTKDPLMPVQNGYIDLFKELVALPSDHVCSDDFRQSGRPALQVQVSLAFWRDSARAVYDPCAPIIQQRIDGIRALREAGIPVVIRIDPLFPRSPLPTRTPKTLGDFGLVEAQTILDLENLVALAKEVQVQHVVYSSAKVVLPRRRKLSDTMKAMRAVYQALSEPGKPVWRGGSWRLPKQIVDRHVLAPFLKICGRHGVQAKFCMQDLIQTM